jgi:hypothetical protein
MTDRAESAAANYRRLRAKHPELSDWTAAGIVISSHYMAVTPNAELGAVTRAVLAERQAEQDAMTAELVSRFDAANRRHLAGERPGGVA